MSIFCNFNVSLDSFIVQTLEWTLPYDLYKEQLVDHAALLFTLSGQVTETKQVLATRFSFRLCIPDIVITVGLTLEQHKA